MFTRCSPEVHQTFTKSPDGSPCSGPVARSPSCCGPSFPPAFGPSWKCQRLPPAPARARAARPRRHRWAFRWASRPWGAELISSKMAAGHGENMVYIHIQCIYIYVYIYVCVCLYIYKYIYVCVCACVRVCVRVCVYVCVYVCVCVCTIWIDVKLLSFSFFFPLPF